MVILRLVVYFWHATRTYSDIYSVESQPFNSFPAAEEQGELDPQVPSYIRKRNAPRLGEGEGVLVGEAV